MYPIYLVSLEKDLKRREILRERFPNTFDNFIHINAVDGRCLTAKEYYEKARPYFIKHNKIMSPAELGCTLSHIKALESFLLTNEPYALILEDDVIGNDADIQAVFKLANHLSSKTVLLCGNQDALPSKNRFVRRAKIDELCQVSGYSYGFFWGAFSYLVTRESALQIIKKHKSSITLADKWDELLKDDGFELLYSPILKHPVESIDSYLEQDRTVFKQIKHQRTLIDKLFSWSAPEKAFRLLVNRVKKLWCILQGYKRLK